MLYLPASAYHATVYADWTDATYCRLPRHARMAALPEAQRRRVIASASVTASDWRALPAYMLPDCHGNGCAAYAAPHYSIVPAYEDWQAMILDACRRLRRWRFYSD